MWHFPLLTLNTDWNSMIYSENLLLARATTLNAEGYFVLGRAISFTQMIKPHSTSMR